MTKLETNEVQVSRNIKSCREKFGKTQEQVAVILGITKQTYLKIENNPMTCSINKLNDVSKANVPITERKKEFKYMEEYGTYNKKYGYNYKDASKRKNKEVDIIKGLPINMFANMHKNNCEKEKEE